MTGDVREGLNETREEAPGALGRRWRRRGEEKMSTINSTHLNEVSRLLTIGLYDQTYHN